MKRAASLLLGLLLLLSTAAFAQITKGSISGTVLDPSGASVPDAQVSAKELHTGTVFNTKTDRNGNYRFNLIPPGNYTVTITKEGFSKVSQQNVGVNSGQDAGMGTISLQVGGASNVVEVTAETPLVESTQAQVTNTFETTQLQQFPGVTENEGLDNLALYIPGVTATRSDNGFTNTNGTGFSVNGVRQRNNDQQIDGQNNNDNSVTGPALAVTDNEFVGEYTVITNNFGPEYGRNAGSVVNVITKSGTNNFHGSLFGSENNNALNSMDNQQKRFEKLTTLPYLNDIYGGGTIGGPIFHNKMFFFGGFDTEIINQNSIYNTGKYTPTPAGLATLGTCFPGNANVALLGQFGAFGNPTALQITPGSTTTTDALGIPVTGCPGVEVAQVQRSVGSPAHIYDTIGRIDYIGTNNTIYGRYLIDKSTFFGQNDNGAAGYIYNVPAQTQVMRLSWTHNLTQKMVNELSVNFGRLNVEFGGGSQFEPAAGQIGNALTNIAFTSGAQMLGFGPATNLPQSRIVNTWQAQDNWRYLLGKHQLKAGVNWTYQRSPNIFLPNYNGAWTYSSLTNFLNNAPRSVSIVSGSPSLDFREYDTFAYFGDDWKITNHLTMNLGLTYTYFGQPENLFHQLDVARESGPNPFFNPALPLETRVAPTIPTVKTAFGPGVGFAWSPGFATKTVVRGGYRLAFDPPFYNIYLNEATAAPQVLSRTIRPTSPLPLPANPTGVNVRSALAPFIAFGTQDPRNLNQTDVSPDFKPDYYHEWSFGIEQQLSKAAAVEVRYVGNTGRNLFQSIDQNPFIADLAANFPNLVPAGLTPCTTPVVPTALGRADCNRGVVRRRANTGESNYNAFQAEFRSNNMFDQLTVRAAYTFSKALDNASEIFGTFASGTTTAFAQSPVDINHGEYGRSQYDIPHNFSLNFVEQIPFMRKQNGVIGHVLGGWALSGAWILGSGVPYTPVQFCIAFCGSGMFNGGDYVDLTFNNAFTSGVENLRPFLGNPAAPATSVGIYAGDLCAYEGLGCSLAPNTLMDFGAANANSAETVVTKDKVRYIINAATSEGIFGTPFGNVPRNSARDWKTNTTNFAVYKNLKLTERVGAQFQMTMLNVFNHRTFTSVDPFLDDAGFQDSFTGFGDPTLTNGGNRKILFGMRIHF